MSARKKSKLPALPSARPAPSFMQRLKRRLLLMLTALLVLGALAGTALVSFYVELAQQYDLQALGQMPERTQVLDHRGELLGTMHGENRIVVPMERISSHFVQALLAREDSRFYDHGGVDYLGVLRAAVRNARDGRVVQGASTLTMQLARNSYPQLSAKTFHRKFLEVMLARRIEAQFSKQQILELYMNRIFFGAGVYGIQRAAQVYFGKEAAALSLGESAMIAGIIRGPMRFSPFRNYQGAIIERNTVLKRMLSLGLISPEQEQQARYEDPVMRAEPIFVYQGDWALDAVRRDLDRLLEEREIQEGGLVVHTTLNRELQRAAEQHLENRLREIEKQPGYKHTSKASFDQGWDGNSELTSTPYLQAALSVIDNHNGGILAVVGGRDYRQSKFNRASMGRRQIGSTIKPFVYAAALQRGMLPGTLVDDAPLRRGEIDGAYSGWSPQNSDGRFLGPLPWSQGLIQSRNTMTVRVGNFAGLKEVRELLFNAGLDESGKPNPQWYIGNFSGNPRELASAFSVFANDGLRRRPFLISKITDKAGNTLYEDSALEIEVMAPGVAQLMRRTLSEVLEDGTAATLRSQHDFKEIAGGKTGTTNDFRDAWFAGYTSRFSAAVWVGLDQPSTIMQGGFGARLALPIWADVAKAAVRLGYSAPMPSGLPLRRVSLCRLSSALATASCRAAGHAYEDELPAPMLPLRSCPQHGGAGLAKSPRNSPSPAQGGGILQKLRGWLGR